MGRMKSDSIKSVSAELTVTDLVYYVARNSDRMITEKVLGGVLFSQAAMIQAAMLQAAMDAIKENLDALAGITSPLEVFANWEVTEVPDVSASLPATRGKAQKA